MCEEFAKMISSEGLLIDMMRNRDSVLRMEKRTNVYYRYMFSAKRDLDQRFAPSNG